MSELELLVGRRVKPLRSDGTTPGTFYVAEVDDCWLRGRFCGRTAETLLNANAFESFTWEDT